MAIPQQCSTYTNKHGVQMKVISQDTPSDHSDLVHAFANMTHEKMAFFFAQFEYGEDAAEPSFEKIQ